MRLTLRTLLAYLDDTLEPAQAKLIGQKAAESEAAQELMGRIKQVTRRRRLTTPPSGPGAKTDPNMIAEYLDNTLPSEQLAEIEEICLASDVHLAEIAACHQILTLVLGEPALVPPTARQRMYALVKGPEAIPFRKPSAGVDHNLDSAADEAPETDETLRLGLPAYHGQGAWTQRLALVGGGLALVALLAVAIWQVLRPSHSTDNETSDQAAVIPDRTVANKKPQPKPPEPKKDDTAGKDPRDRKPARDQVPGKPANDKGQAGKTDKQTEKSGKRNKDRKPRDKRDQDKSRFNKLEGGTIAPDKPIPGTDPKVVGRYVLPAAREAPAILLRRGKDQDEWHRLEGRNPAVSTGDTLVSLPGYRSQVRLRNGLDMTLWGDLRELSLISPLQESVVTIHDPGDFDLDLTLDRGRIVIANPQKAQARLRVRFANPTTTNGKDFWEITLPEKGSRVSLELWGRYPAEIPFSLKEKTRLGPESELYLFVLDGQASATIDYTTQSMEEPPGPGMIIWKSKTGQASSPINIKQRPDWATPRGYPAFPPNMDKRLIDLLEGQRAAMLKGLRKLSTRMSGTKVKVGLIEALNSDDQVQRLLAVRALGAIDDLSDLLDGLGDEKYPEVRQAAIEDLRHWIGLHWKNDLVLHEVLMKTKGYTRGQANTIMELLHSFSDKARAEPETYARLIDYLRQDKAAIRVLAHWHLVRMVPAGFKIPYDPMGDSDQIDKAYDAWKDLVPEGSLPKAPKPAKQPKKPMKP